MRSVCVFCGARSGDHSIFTEAAAALGKSISHAGFSLVYGGGSVGMMGALADAALEVGGQVIGVIPEALANVELMHPAVKDMRIVADMHARKAMMHELSDAYIALPGGYGTMEELFEVLCWGQLEFHQSPVALLNLDGFYDGLVSLVNGMVQRGFLDSDSRDLLSVVNSIAEAEAWLNQRTAAT